jgi:hypothetical protein
LFVVHDVPPELRNAMLDMGFASLDGSLARSFDPGAAHLDEAFENFDRYIEEVAGQAAGLSPVPWDDALEALLTGIAGRELMWWLTGSAALAVRGVDLAPRDVDLITDDASAHRLGESLADALIEPITPTADWIGRWWGRAFLRERIEWTGGVTEAADRPRPGDVGPTAEARLETVSWRGFDIRVPPIDLQLDAAERRGMHDRAAGIRAHLAALAG